MKFRLAKCGTSGTKVVSMLDFIAKNNWANTNAQFIRKTENYFVIDIKESDVKDTNATDRNIFTFGS